MGANWFRRRTEGVWCAPWLVSRPRKKPTKQKRERAHGSRGLTKGRAFPRKRRVPGVNVSSGWTWMGGEPPYPSRDQRARTWTVAGPEVAVHVSLRDTRVGPVTGSLSDPGSIPGASTLKALDIRGFSFFAPRALHFSPPPSAPGPIANRARLPRRASAKLVRRETRATC